MKIFISLLLLGIVAVNCAPQGQPGNGGSPCQTPENIESCTCKDGAEYTSQADLDANCTGGNPVESCVCLDGTTWSPTGPANNSSEESGESSEESSEETG